MSVFVDGEIGCFGRPLGRLATVGAGGGPRVVPVAFGPNSIPVG
jgi:hypothetical protein